MPAPHSGKEHPLRPQVSMRLHGSDFKLRAQRDLCTLPRAPQGHMPPQAHLLSRIYLTLTQAHLSLLSHPPQPQLTHFGAARIVCSRRCRFERSRRPFRQTPRQTPHMLTRSLSCRLSHFQSDDQRVGASGTWLESGEGSRLQEAGHGPLGEERATFAGTMLISA